LFSDPPNKNNAGKKLLRLLGGMQGQVINVLQLRRKWREAGNCLLSKFRAVGKLSKKFFLLENFCSKCKICGLTPYLIEI